MTQSRAVDLTADAARAAKPNEPTPREVVVAYADAKGAGDIDAALAVCHPTAVFETVAFQAVSSRRAETRVQASNFLRAFPDYHVEFGVLEQVDDLVLSSGTITGTMRGSLAGVEPTGRRFALPFACHWWIRDGLIVREQFFFDFNQMCEQLGLDVRDAARRFRHWRTHLMGSHEAD